MHVHVLLSEVVLVLDSRPEDGSLMTLSHLALILVYSCVMAIKTCELSSEACSKYGFGNSAKGEAMMKRLVGPVD